MNRRDLAAVAALPAVVAALMSVPAARAEAGPGPQGLAVAAAERLIATQPARIRRSSRDGFVRQDVVSGTSGLQYVSYERTYAGLPVIGGDFVVVTDAGGTVLSTSVNQAAVLSAPTTPKITPADATRAAQAKAAQVKAGDVAGTSAPRLTVLATGSGRLVYETTVHGGGRGAAPTTVHVLTDARTGATAGSWTGEVSDALGSANTHYSGTQNIEATFDGTQYGLYDATRPGLRCGGMDGRTFVSPDNAWGDGSASSLETACADAMFGAEREWDLLREWFNRNGFDAHGRAFPVRVGWDQSNAHWLSDDRRVELGRGGTGWQASIDVVAHEFGHSVFKYTPGGDEHYNSEKQALNESTGDILGTLTEWYAGVPADPPDYMMFEQFGSADRYMWKPSEKVRSGVPDPDCYSDSVTGMEEHTAAGPQNHWFYLLAEGSKPNDPAHGRPNSPTCDNSTITGLGRRKAATIYMETLNRKLSYWDYPTARFFSLEATAQLYPNSCAEWETVRAAWNAVAVPAKGQEPLDCPNASRVRG
ncbi:M4 family metallopeptidase [Actinomadura barringtoniae]|uniref:M4 family metallopeptidase n=1 Tax=Actinomadura barringtoniae TaxID=1427535 RepID=A0A939P6L1_9ACTN|nr:M4 family metallopeptidase [Actinomadura barringtoniae]MBO2446338.1 M4 family metallopeptidase [Actinomadura barringtoniae]